MINSPAKALVFYGFPWRKILWIAIFNGLLAFACAALFARHQSIWVDESTQLSGLSLEIADLVAYLQNDPRVVSRFEVPPDRMPPLSYLAGKGWCEAFGLGVSQMRFFGVTLFALTAMVMTVAGSLLSWTDLSYQETPVSDGLPDEFRRKISARSGLVTGLIMAVSSTAVMTAVEIRAYPLFLFLSSLSLLLLVTYFLRASYWLLAALVITLLAATYTHFFGIVLTGSTVVAILVDCVLKNKSYWPPTIVTLVLTVGLVGWIPFVRAAFEVTGVPQHTDSSPMMGVFKLWGRLAASSSTGVIPGLEYIAVLIISLLLGACLIHAFCMGFVSRLSIYSALLSGLFVIASAAFFVKGFNASSISYNIWLLPFAYVLIGSGLGQVYNRGLRNVLSSSLTLWIGSQILSCAILATKGSVFAHGTIPQIDLILGNIDTKKVIVVHDDLSSLGTNGFPLWWQMRDEVLQLVYRKDGTFFDFRQRSGLRNYALSELRTEYALVLETTTLYGKDVARLVRTGIPPELEFHDVAVKTLESANYKIVFTNVYYSLMTNKVTLMSKELPTISSEE